MTELLAKLFKETDAEDIDKVVYMLQGRVVPQYVKSDFGLGEKMVIKAAIKALNVDEKLFRAEQKETGDTGISVEKLRQEVMTIGQKNLSVSEVFDHLSTITKTVGDGSQERKLALLAQLIQTLDPLSTRYIVRIPTQTLRLGFSDMTVLDALSWMVSGDKSHRKAIEEAYLVRPDLGYIARVVKTKGIKGLKNVQPQVFTPILMMKAQRLPSPKDIFDKLKVGVIEPKYDGFRLQIHFEKKEGVKLYSRGLEDVTYMYPDLVEGIKKELKADSAILEGEAIGFDAYTGSFLPFQETVQRKRKYDIEEKAKEIPLKMFVFELLYLDGASYLHKPLEERIAQLRKHLKQTGDIHSTTLLLSPENGMGAEEDLHLAFDEAISKGLEGIMVKKKDGFYQPGARGWNWIKYKRSYSSKINDTIDCLVMGFDKGKGKRAGFGIGAFLVGIYDAQDDTFKTVAKIGTGLSDEQWRMLFKRCSRLQTDNKPALYVVDKIVYVDIWVKPEIVVEIKADEITRSQMHTAGRIMQKTKTGKAEEVKEPGYALRFPRLTRFRDDKKPEDATTLQELEAMFGAQLQKEGARI
jgi:DNA ligase-1